MTIQPESPNNIINKGEASHFRNKTKYGSTI